MTELSDAELLKAHCAGDQDAFATLLRRHQDRLWTIAVQITKNPADAEDALQNALTSLIHRADSFAGRSQVSTWLHRIVVNAAIDVVRRRGRRQADELPAQLLSQMPGPEAQVLNAETAETLRRALMELPPEQRIAVMLVYQFGFTANESAEILGCAPATVRTRCFRGRTALRQLLTTAEPARS